MAAIGEGRRQPLLILAGLILAGVAAIAASYAVGVLASRPRGATASR
jgi:F0F1-type ATP synthase membrane subunit c/vacuolar-type H+-ATPase subunit K